MQELRHTRSSNPKPVEGPPAFPIRGEQQRLAQEILAIGTRVKERLAFIFEAQREAQAIYRQRLQESRASTNAESYASPHAKEAVERDLFVIKEEVEERRQDFLELQEKIAALQEERLDRSAHESEREAEQQAAI